MFEYVIIGFILISSINLMLDNPLQDPKGILPKIIKYTDLVVDISAMPRSIYFIYYRSCPENNSLWIYDQ